MAAKCCSGNRSSLLSFLVLLCMMTQSCYILPNKLHLPGYEMHQSANPRQSARLRQSFRVYLIQFTKHFFLFFFYLQPLQHPHTTLAFNSILLLMLFGILVVVGSLIKLFHYVNIVYVARCLLL